LQLGQQEGLSKVDQQEVALRRMRYEVQLVREDEGQRIAREGANNPTDVLDGIATQIDLDLKYSCR
jgi:hypothetical protein